ncbi:alpha/beta fold hydrolase [Bacillus sp. Marseille-P3661]|uniref:alpha/beta fold hydrolase n=1 Tax=Bacillus sp. Marseille-P3661 TaxID=1936234 RepID=UPI000C820B90|nr:alpha/beta fold hydrolase [Bacillus sp. Marseille-P3661]
MIAECNGEQIYYEVFEGNKENESFDAIILLHSLGVDHRLWKYQIEALRDVAPRVVTIDARGHGISTANTGISEEIWIEDIKILCETLSLKKVVICGISMGGVQAIGFSIKYPQYVAALILADTFAKIDPAQVETKIKLTGGVAKEQGMKQYGATYLDNTLSNSPTANDIRQDLNDAIINMDIDDYYESVRACFSTNNEEQLSQINVPVLVLIGEEDFKTPIELSRTIQQQIPNALLLTVPNGMHLSNVDNPVVFNKFITGFLNLV